jgi:hypothetical protein
MKMTRKRIAFSEFKGMVKWLEEKHAKRELPCKCLHFELMFYQTGIAEAIHIRCPKCGMSEDVSDYECW